MGITKAYSRKKNSLKRNHCHFCIPHAKLSKYQACKHWTLLSTFSCLLPVKFNFWWHHHLKESNQKLKDLKVALEKITKNRAQKKSNHLKFCTFYVHDISSLKVYLDQAVLKSLSKSTISLFKATDCRFLE